MCPLKLKNNAGENYITALEIQGGLKLEQDNVWELSTDRPEFGVVEKGMSAKENGKEQPMKADAKLWQCDNLKAQGLWGQFGVCPSAFITDKRANIAS